MDYVNEAVNIDKELIFVAVPKTGTTSVRKQLRQKGKPFLPYPHLNILQIRTAIDLFFVAINLCKNKSFPNTKVKSNEQIKLEAEKFFKKSFKFASVRNPWERAVSLYSRKEGVQVSKNISFEEFIEHHFYASNTYAIPSLHKNQFDWLSDENGELLMDYVFRLEDFSQAIKEIESRTSGRIVLQERIENKNSDSRSSGYQEIYNSNTKNIIAKRFEKDIDFFKFKF